MGDSHQKWMKSSLRSLIVNLHLTKSFPKVLNAGFSFLTYILLLRTLGMDVFAQLLVMYGFAGVFLWSIDIGISRLYIHEYSKGNFEKARSLWGVRLLGSILAILILGQVVLNFSNTVTFFLISTALLDLFTDSFIEPRIINSKIKIAIMIQTWKRVSILFLIMALLTLNREVGPLAVFLVYIFGCIPVIAIEVVRNGTYRIKDLEINDFKLAIGYWIQNAGTTLASLDIPLISFLYGAEFTVVISSIRKITTAIAIFGMTTSTMVFSESSGIFKYEKLKDKIRSAIVFTIMQSCACIVFLDPIFNYVIKIENTASNKQLSFFLLAITSVGIYLSILNSVLLGLKKISQVTIATFLSSGLYLLSLLIFSKTSLNHLGIMLSICLNYGIELLLYRKYLKEHLVRG